MLYSSSVSVSVSVSLVSSSSSSVPLSSSLVSSEVFFFFGAGAPPFMACICPASESAVRQYLNNVEMWRDLPSSGSLISSSSMTSAAVLASSTAKVISTFVSNPT